MVVVQSLSCVRLLRPCGLQPARLLCPQYSPGKNTGEGCYFLLQGIFPTQESNPGLLHCRQILYQLSYDTQDQIIYNQKHFQFFLSNLGGTLAVFLPADNKTLPRVHTGSVLPAQVGGEGAGGAGSKVIMGHGDVPKSSQAAIWDLVVFLKLIILQS